MQVEPLQHRIQLGRGLKGMGVGIDRIERGELRKLLRRERPTDRRQSKHVAAAAEVECFRRLSSVASGR